MEVVVALTEGDEGSDDVVARRVAVVEGLVTEPVGKRVHAESGLLNEESTAETGVDEATEIVTPAEAGDQRREDEGPSEHPADVVGVLMHNFVIDMSVDV